LPVLPFFVGQRSSFFIDRPESLRIKNEYDFILYSCKLHNLRHTGHQTPTQDFILQNIKSVLNLIKIFILAPG